MLLLVLKKITAESGKTSFGEVGMPVISADSHVVEAKEVYIGLEEKFGDEAPRVMYENTENDSIVIPAGGPRGVRKRMAFAGLRSKEEVELTRKHARKPEVDDISTG